MRDEADVGVERFGRPRFVLRRHAGTLRRATDSGLALGEFAFGVVLGHLQKLGSEATIVSDNALTKSQMASHDSAPCTCQTRHPAFPSSACSFCKSLARSRSAALLDGRDATRAASTRATPSSNVFRKTLRRC